MVNSETSVVRFDCDGYTNQYSFLFPITQTSQVSVYAYDKVDKYDALLVENTHYIVTPATGGYKYGGTITIRTWNSESEEYEPYYFGTNVRITIERAPAVLQQSEYRNNEIVPKEQLENDIDVIYYHLQKLYNSFTHILKSSPSDPNEMLLPPAETRANHVLAFDLNGDPVAGETIVTPVTDYMAQFLSSEVWDDLVDGGFFEKVMTYEKVKNGFDSVADGYTTDPSGVAPELEAISNLRTVSLVWFDLIQITSLSMYVIERSELNSSEGFTQIAATPRTVTTYVDAPSYNLEGDTPTSKSYWYRVKGIAVDESETSYSDTIEVVVYPTGLNDIEGNIITAVHIVSGSVETRHLTSRAVTAEKVDTDSVTLNTLTAHEYTYIDGGEPDESEVNSFDGGLLSEIDPEEIEIVYNDNTGAQDNVPIDHIAVESPLFLKEGFMGTLQSINYVKNKSGARLSQNGEFEAYSGKFRGRIEAATGTFKGDLKNELLHLVAGLTEDKHHYFQGGYYCIPIRTGFLSWDFCGETGKYYTADDIFSLLIVYGYSEGEDIECSDGSPSATELVSCRYGGSYVSKIKFGTHYYVQSKEYYAGSAIWYNTTEEPELGTYWTLLVYKYVSFYDSVGEIINENTEVFTSEFYPGVASPDFTSTLWVRDTIRASAVRTMLPVGYFHQESDNNQSMRLSFKVSGDTIRFVKGLPFTAVDREVGDLFYEDDGSGNGIVKIKLEE